MRVFSDSNEGVDDMSAHIHWNVFDAISTYVGTVYCPIAKITHYARSAVTWTKENIIIYVVEYLI